MNKDNLFHFLSAWKEIILASLLVIVCLSLFNFFPTDGLAQEITVILAIFFVIPALYIKLVLKKPLRDFGWQIGNWKMGVFWGAFSLIASLAIFYALFHYTRFPEEYILPAFIKQSFPLFLAYEFFAIGFFVALYEFFFRGFVMFSFSSRLKLWAPAIQFAVFLLFLWFAENLYLANSPYVIIAFFAGWITNNSKSLLYSITYGLIFMLVADSLIIKLVQ